MPEPTYRVETQDDGSQLFTCLWCEAEGREHVATDAELFTQHMAQRHDGTMLPAPAPTGDRAAGSPAPKGGVQVATPPHDVVPKPS